MCPWACGHALIMSSPVKLYLHVKPLILWTNVHSKAGYLQYMLVEKLSRWPVSHQWQCPKSVWVTVRQSLGWLIVDNSTDFNTPTALRWRHHEHDSVSNHKPHNCLRNRLFRRRSKKTPKHSVTGLCVGNSPHKWPVTRKMFPFNDVIMGDPAVTHSTSKWLCTWLTL